MSNTIEPPRLPILGDLVEVLHEGEWKPAKVGFNFTEPDRVYGMFDDPKSGFGHYFNYPINEYRKSWRFR